MTIDDVARAAGVSSGTVSRCLNGKNWVSPQAKAAVTSAIETLGYVPNGSAQKLARQRTDYIGCVFSQPLRLLSENPVFAVMLEDLTRRLSTFGRSTVLLLAHDADEEVKILRYAGAQHVDGLIMMTPSAGNWLLTELARTGFPVLTAGPVSDDPDWSVPFVGVDDAMGSTQAIEHLLDTGRRAIGVVSGPLTSLGARTRLEAALTALGGAPRERVEVVPTFSIAAGHDGSRALLERCPDLDAVYVASDVLAIGAMGFLEQSKRRVPDDVAVVGFDDVTGDPRLTTIATVGGGPTAAELIVDLVDGKDVKSVLHATALVHRTST